MAIWQVSFVFVHKNGKIDYNEKHLLGTLEAIETILPQRKSWHKSIKQYGDLDSTCLEFFLNNEDVIEEVALRIDIRCITHDQLSLICCFARENNFLIKYGEDLFDPTVEKFIDIIKFSDAKRYIDDPMKFLKELKAGNTDGDNFTKTVDDYLL